MKLGKPRSWLHFNIILEYLSIARLPPWRYYHTADFCLHFCVSFGELSEISRIFFFFSFSELFRLKRKRVVFGLFGGRSRRLEDGIAEIY